MELKIIINNGAAVNFFDFSLNLSRSQCMIAPRSIQSIQHGKGALFTVIKTIGIPSGHIVQYVIGYFITVRCPSYYVVMISALPVEFDVVTSGKSCN